MKTGIVIGVLAGIAIAVIAVAAILVLNILPVNSVVSTDTPGPTPITSASPAATQAPKTTPPPATATPTPVAAPSPSPSPSPAASPGATVNFNLSVTEFTQSGLSVTVTAQLKNTGTAPAHNTRARVEVFSQGSRIKVNGQDYVEESFGTIDAAITKTSKITMSFSFSDGAKVLSNGASVKLTVISDEKTQTFNYDY